MMRALQIRQLGQVEYEDGLAMQRLLAAARAAGTAPDTLLLLEHPRVITLGRGAQASHVLWDPTQLQARGFALHHTDRGGDVTYHGPGQLVGYPVLDLKPDRKDVRKYVSSVEELMLRSAREFGVAAERVAGRTGIWVKTGLGAGGGDWEKLGAIGVHLSRWITTHGFAFNVNTRLEDFRAIVPCGISDAGVCSLASRLGRAGKSPPSMQQVEEQIARHASQIWESELLEVPHELATISLTVVREGLQGDELLLLRRVPARGGFWQTLTGKVELGESALAAAARELFEETGFAPRLEEIRALDYVHSFALDPVFIGTGSAFAGAEPAMASTASARSAANGASPRPPLFCRETSFALRVAPGDEPRLDPREHEAHRWVSLEDALPLLPFAGLRRAASLAIEQLAATTGR